jgi:hypothetical protein
VLVPVALFLALHMRAVDYDFVWTDQAEIERGMLIRPPGRILAAFGEPMYRALADADPTAVQPYYRPLQVVTASLVDHHLGRRPENFRPISFAIGAATMAMFFCFVLPLTRDPRAAALAASIVAVHPAGIEDYVWISGVAAAFAAFFVCASLTVVPHLMRAQTSSSRAVLWFLGTAALVGGLLSKESAVVIPALTLACVASLVMRDRASDGRSLGAHLSDQRAALLLAGTQLIVVLLYLLVARPWLLGGSLSGAHPIRGDWTVHLMTVLATWVDRLAWTFAPMRSTTSDVVSLGTLTSPAAWLGILLAAAAPLVWLWLLRRGAAVAALGWAWMWIAFLPTSGIAPLTHVVAVRYISLSVFGVALLWLALLEVLRSRAPRQWVSTAVGIALVLALAERTWARLPDWRSDFTLFTKAVAEDPLYREGYYVLAVSLAEQRHFTRARQRLNQLRIANGQFGERYSFVREADVALLLCMVNLEIDDPEDSLLVLQQELRPGSTMFTSAPDLARCAIESLERAGRTAEARELRRSIGTTRNESP